MQTDIERVLEEHKVLDDAAAQLELQIASGEDEAHEMFISLAHFADLLVKHLLGEQDVLEDASARRSEAVSGYSRTMRTEPEILRYDWDEYLSLWSEEDSVANWNLFAEHSAAILARIRRRVRRENELLLGSSTGI